MAGLLPTIGAAGSYVRTDPENIARYNTNTYGIALTQPLFNWANIQQYRQGKLAVAASEACRWRTPFGIPVDPDE